MPFVKQCMLGTTQEIAMNVDNRLYLGFFFTENELNEYKSKLKTKYIFMFKCSQVYKYFFIVILFSLRLFQLKKVDFQI